MRMSVGAAQWGKCKGGEGRVVGWERWALVLIDIYAKIPVVVRIGVFILTLQLTKATVLV